ncbi:MAG: hypothetical protein AMXMBFR34_48310 [Myxococcaceae bacterium]
MRNATRGLWLIAAVAAVFAMGCGETSGSDAGTTCTSDASCGTGKVCHPVTKACVPSCTGSVDCPSTAKTCAKYDGTAGSASAPGFCQCSTDALCGGNLVCSTATKMCENKCTSNSSCPSGFTCNTTTGQCASGGSDAGMDAGTACTGLSQCTYPEVCNFTSGRCVTGASCNTAGAQPDTCGYAGYCTANSNCAQVEYPTCSNFGPSTRPVVFNPATSMGPITYYIEPDPSPATAVCFKGFFVHSFFLNVYRTDTDWPPQLSAMPGAFYVRTDGTQQDITAGLPGSYYVPNGKQLRLRKYLCATTSSSLNAGFYYTNGNEACYATSGAVGGSANCTSNNDCGSLTCNTGSGTCE